MNPYPSSAYPPVVAEPISIPMQPIPANEIQVTYVPMNGMQMQQMQSVPANGIQIPQMQPIPMNGMPIPQMQPMSGAEMMQPMSGAEMMQQMPLAYAGNNSCGQALSVLNTCGGLFVKQKAEMLEAMTGYETENKYKVYLTGPDCMRGSNQEAYFSAKEESECCQRQFCGNARSFQMKIYSPDGTVALVLDRPFKCSCVCCFLPEMQIVDGDGNKIGSVKSIFDCCGDKFTIYDHEDMPVLGIHGDCCQWGKFCTCPIGPCAEVRFDILNVATGSSGYIKKIWSGIGKEAFTDADSFTLSFPSDSTIYHKILLLGAVFLIDFMYFENNNSRNEDSRNF